MVRNNNNQGRFACQQCPKRFGARTTLHTHVEGVHGGKTYQCTNCDAVSIDPSNYKRHVAQCEGRGPWWHCPWDNCRHYHGRKDNVMRHRGTCREGIRLGSRRWPGDHPAVFKITLKQKTDMEAGRLDVRTLQTGEPRQAPGQQAQAQVPDEDPAQHDAAVLGQGAYQPAANVNLDDVGVQVQDGLDFEQELARSALLLANNADLQAQDYLGQNGQDFNLGMDPQELNMDNIGLQAQVNLGQNGQDFTINPQQYHWDNAGVQPQDAPAYNGQGWDQGQNYLVPNFNNAGYLPQGAMAYGGQGWNQGPMPQNPTFDNAGHWGQGQQDVLGDGMFLGQAQYQDYNNVDLQGQLGQDDQLGWGAMPQQQFVGDQVQDVPFMPTMDQNLEEEFWGPAVF